MTEFQPLTWSELLLMAPELLLGVWFVGLVLTDLIMPKSVSRLWIGGLTVTGLLASAALAAWQLADRGSGAMEQAVSLLGDSYRVDGLSLLLKLLLLAGTALVALLGMGTVKHDRAIADKGEYAYLLLPAAMGAMAMVSSGNLVTLYIGLELLSITSYVLVGLRKRSSLSSEAAFKYVVAGGIASAFILFGMSYLYGVTGSVELGAIRDALPEAIERYKAFVYIGFGFMLAGFGVKIAAAPFHAWAPDVYQGAPTPVAAFLSVVSKGATLAVVLRVMYSTALVVNTPQGAEVRDELFFALLLVAAIAMLTGTLAALRQYNVKRLLALSGVANAGYLLVPVGLSVTMMHSNNVSELLFYLTAYLLMTIGAFAVHTAVSRAAGHDKLRGYAGMYYRAPWTAAAMTVFLLSLAGLPVSAGFFGKLFIMLGAAQSKAYWIVAVMVLSSVISYYFYFGLIRQMFMRSAGAVPAARGVVPEDVKAAAALARAPEISAASERDDSSAEEAEDGSSLQDGRAAGPVFPEDGGLLDGWASGTGVAEDGSPAAGNAARTRNAGDGSLSVGYAARSRNEGDGSLSGGKVESGIAENSEHDGPEPAADGQIRIHLATGLVIWICAAATLALGLFPGPLLEWIDGAFAFQGDLLR